jgi:hypothetical protein
VSSAVLIFAAATSAAANRSAVLPATQRERHSEAPRAPYSDRSMLLCLVKGFA